MALIAATFLHPGDYFAINSTPEQFATLGMAVVDLPAYQKQLGWILKEVQVVQLH